VHAAKRMAKEVLEGKLKPDDINEEVLNDRLYTAKIPDPDLLIRPGGEKRLSNFLLWQSAYTELCILMCSGPILRRAYSRGYFGLSEEKQKIWRDMKLLKTRVISALVGVILLIAVVCSGQMVLGTAVFFCFHACHV